MPAPEPSKIRRSRITAACAVCRAKRQKCSGEKPTCLQCRQSNEECAWSDSKKRGPAKDYLRSLQDRLQETERILAATLDRVDDAELNNMLANDNAEAPSHQVWSNSLSGPDYWRHFPLNSVESIREWQRHRNGDATSAFSAAASIESQQQPSAATTFATSSHMSSAGDIPLEPSLADPEGQQDIGAASHAFWPNHPTRQLKPHERDVAEALYSISNSGNGAFTQQQPPAAPMQTNGSNDQDG